METSITQPVSRKGLKRLSRLQQPVENRMGIDLKDARCASNAESLSQTGDDMSNEANLAQRSFTAVGN